MKTFYISLFALSTVATSLSQEISSLKLKITSQVLSELTNKAIDDDRKDLIAIYYSTYQAIKLEHSTTEEHDQYFNEVKDAYESEIGRWVVGLVFPPEEYLIFVHMEKEPPEGPRIKIGVARELQIAKKINTLNITEKDLEQLSELRKLQKEGVDIKRLRARMGRDSISPLRRPQKPKQ